MADRELASKTCSKRNIADLTFAVFLSFSFYPFQIDVLGQYELSWFTITRLRSLWNRIHSWHSMLVLLLSRVWLCWSHLLLLLRLIHLHLRWSLVLTQRHSHSSLRLRIKRLRYLISLKSRRSVRKWIIWRLLKSHATSVLLSISLQLLWVDLR